MLNALEARTQKWKDHGIASVTPVGDGYSPGNIMDTVYSGHQFAHDFMTPHNQELELNVERFYLQDTI